jgi:ribosome modulation factor
MTAHSEGYEAALLGQPMQANPYMKLSPLHFSWANGWDEATADLLRCRKGSAA